MQLRKDGQGGGSSDGDGEELSVSQLLGLLVWVLEVVEMTQMKAQANDSEELPYDTKGTCCKYKLRVFQANLSNTTQNRHMCVHKEFRSLSKEAKANIRKVGKTFKMNIVYVNLINHST